MGSAAINLFFIVGCCVVCVSSPQIRFIKKFSVYVVTATCSLFAYLWLWIIMGLWTPNVITLVEASLTLLMFPALLLLVYWADTGFLCFKRAKLSDEQKVGCMFVLWIDMLVLWRRVDMLFSSTEGEEQSKNEANNIASFLLLQNLRPGVLFEGEQHAFVSQGLPPIPR